MNRFYRVMKIVAKSAICRYQYAPGNVCSSRKTKVIL